MTVYISRNGRFIHQAAHIEGGIVWGVLYEVNEDGGVTMVDNWYGFTEKEIAMYWREMR